MATDAGVTDEDMANLTWNPDDGGTYEKVIAKLTVDQNGKRGDEAGFDKSKVEVYGLGLPGSGGRQRPDRVELLHPDHRLAAHRQEPLGHARTSTTTPASRRPSPGGRA